MSMDWDKVKADVEKEWDATIVPALSAFIEVPNQSPSFDDDWETNGLEEKAFEVIIGWMEKQNVKGLTYEKAKEKGRTGFLFVEVAGTEPTKNTVLMYGHMDKQPPLRPWAEGLDPHKAVLRDGKLYGRGGGDDGYSLFSAVSSVVALQRNGIPHGRIVIIIEGAEESGSLDLDFYMEKYTARIGNVDLMICLDSGSLNYTQLWLTTSLRGVAIGELKVSTVKDGIHSGIAGGVVPDSFRIARQLLDRIEDSVTGEVKIPEAHCEIPESAVKAMSVMNDVDFKGQFPLVKGATLEGPDSNDEIALRNFWKPSLTVTGANLPVPKSAGNVIRTETVLKLSIRVPPLCDAKTVLRATQKILTADPPHGAIVSFSIDDAGNGCKTPEIAPWLHTAMTEGSQSAFGNTYACQGMGGSIPFIAMLVNTYPEAQFVVTGVLGPHSNAHGPNEFIDIAYVKGVTYCVSRIVAQHFTITPRA